jgi:hypothetical protein
MQASTTNTWKMTAKGSRIDWPTLREQLDLGIVVTALLGVAPGRRGERGRRLWWPCPIHNDNNPSFCVTPGKPWWQCYGCGEHGDAASLVMKLQGTTFPEAVGWLNDRFGNASTISRSGTSAPLGKTSSRPQTQTSIKPPAQPSGVPLSDALKLVEDAHNALWLPEGARALEYLRGRGLNDETIHRARLGWKSGVSVPVKDGSRFWEVEGITIPWMDRDRLAMVKIRRPKGSAPKYAEAFRDRPSIYPAPDSVRPGKPLIVVEGELDALLVGQVVVDLAGVITLGSASAKPESLILMRLMTAAPWYVALDQDDAGDRSAAWWPNRSIRVTPPDKDWTDAHLGGVNLRRWWTDRLAGIERPLRSTWDELAARRWGPAIGDPTPGIIFPLEAS